MAQLFYQQIATKITRYYSLMVFNKNLHVPVLADEVITYLRLKKGMTVVDCTIGGGGHAEEILRKIGDGGNLVGIDADDETLREAKSRLTDVSDRFRLFHSNYEDIDLVLREANIEKIDGALFDLGVSSLQIENAVRGFSLRSDGPLDMRMNKKTNLKASDIVNSYTKAELASVFKKYGDEHFAEKIAERIARERKRHRIDNTLRLAGIVQEAVPYRYRFRRIHPATKVFMALRIAVNREIECLEAGLTKIVPLMNSGARVCIISFHSIEDRVVKQRFREFAGSNGLRIITKKPIRPQPEEAKNNPRARSAKLRVAERI